MVTGSRPQRDKIPEGHQHQLIRGRALPVTRRDDEAVGGTPTLWARVEDNGIGGARILPGGGLDGIANRIAAAGGTSRLDSPAGGPTTLEVSVPCAS